jgi:uncharacterized protein (UPF0335 family)
MENWQIDLIERIARIEENQKHMMANIHNLPQSEQCATDIKDLKQEVSMLKQFKEEVNKKVAYVEPFGNVAVEAQGCGTPVISTDWGAMTETVEHGKTGFRCRTFRQFVEAAENVGTLDPCYIRRRAINTYSLGVIGRRYDEYFRRLLTLWGEGWYA